MANKKHQRGMTLISWMLVIGIAIFIGMVGIKSLPVYMNHYKVISILKNIAGQPGAADQTPRDISKSLEKRFDIDMVKHVTHKDVKVTGQPGNPRTMVLDYEVRVHMFYNVDAVYSFSENVPLGN